jgi:aspartate kinase
MLELARSGAQVLNARSVELGMNMGAPIRLRSTFEPDNPGTLITHKTESPEYVVCGIACDTNRVAFNIRMNLSATAKHEKNGTVHYLDAITHLFESLKDQGVATDMVTLVGRDNDSASELMFTVDKRAARKVEQSIVELSDELGRPQFSIDTDIARISVVGTGLSCRRGMVAAIFDTLSSASIPVQMLTTGDIRVTALVPARYKNEAIERIHERFCVYPQVDLRIRESRIA